MNFFGPPPPPQKKKKKKKLQSVGIEPTLLRTCALSMRLNHSAKTAVVSTKKKKLLRARVELATFCV